MIASIPLVKTYSTLSSLKKPVSAVTTVFPSPRSIDKFISIFCIIGIRVCCSGPLPKASIPTTIWRFESAAVTRLYPCLVPELVFILALSLSVTLLWTSFFVLPVPILGSFSSRNSSNFCAFFSSVSTFCCAFCGSSAVWLSLARCLSMIC